MGNLSVLVHCGLLVAAASTCCFGRAKDHAWQLEHNQLGKVKANKDKDCRKLCCEVAECRSFDAGMEDGAFYCWLSTTEANTPGGGDLIFDPREDARYQAKVPCAQTSAESSQGVCCFSDALQLTWHEGILPGRVHYLNATECRRRCCSDPTCEGGTLRCWFGTTQDGTASGDHVLWDSNTSTSYAARMMCSQSSAAGGHVWAGMEVYVFAVGVAVGALMAWQCFKKMHKSEASVRLVSLVTPPE